jgi:apolipoprotein N-acyltransferase
MLRFVQFVLLSSGWRRRLLAAGAGATGALAMAPFDLFFGLVPAMTIAVWLIDGAAEGRSRFSLAGLGAAAGAGWWWGFGYFLAGLWWLGAAFLVEADKWAWALPLGVIALPAGLALFPALGFALARLVWSTGGARVLALASGLGAAEWLRAHVLSGFPWNTFGMALAASQGLAQTAALVGVQGLSVLAVALSAVPATCADGEGAAARPTIWRRPPVLAAGLTLLALAGYGSWRLTMAETALVKDVRLRIMQPNIVQDAEFRPENRQAILQRYLALSDRATSPSTNGLSDVTHLIWPESAFPFILSRDAAALAKLGAGLPATTILITGAARFEPTAGTRTGGFYNAIQVIKAGIVIDSYDKVHLVPFGEYLPASTLLRAMGVQEFVHIPGGFEAGGRRRLLDVPGLPPVAPLICYEAIFSGEVLPESADPKAARPGLFLNVTNDSWFGRTPGPYQHLAQARLRSIEAGLPMIRAANTGISAIIDPYGRILDQRPLGSEAVLDSPLPAAIAAPVFSRHGYATSLSVWLLALLGSQLLQGDRWRWRSPIVNPGTIK